MLKLQSHIFVVFARTAKRSLIYSKQNLIDLHLDIVLLLRFHFVKYIFFQWLVF